jgi:hypothetical protein
MWIAGVVLLCVGAVTFPIGGGLIAANEEYLEEPSEKGYAIPILWGVGGAMVATGIVLTAVGASRARREKRRMEGVSLTLTPGGAAAHVTF